MWCGTYRTEYALNSIKTDVHSPGNFRCVDINSVKVLQYWLHDFRFGGLFLTLILYNLEIQCFSFSFLFFFSFCFLRVSERINQTHQDKCHVYISIALTALILRLYMTQAQLLMNSNKDVTSEQRLYLKLAETFLRGYKRQRSRTSEWLFQKDSHSTQRKIF